MIRVYVFLLFAASVYGHGGRILNGSTAAVGQFPYQVSLRDKPNRHFCGAWDPQNIANDIAVVKLKEPIALGGNVQKIELEANEINDGLSGVISGWGLTSINGNHATNLQFLSTTIINHEECKILQLPQYMDFVKEFNICGTNQFGYGVCNEDSGGPLVVNGKQVGVVSWSDECGGGRGDIYAKVSYYINWINDSI
ncbi:hypothetical protein FQR65_LT04889 [Abscondita terminalis]|nr:hypothetical protein FQR65_LT04889 [Abscondita terminalis]